jgi:excisionase family DNA binding protein
VGEVLTPAEVAKLLRRHEKTVIKHAQNGTLPGKKVGNQWRFVKKDVLAVVAGR